MFGRLQHGTLSFARWRYQRLSETVLHNAVARLLSVSYGLSCIIVLNVFVETGVPTSVDFVQCEPTQMVVAYTSANAYVFDIEKCKPVVTLDYKPSLGIIIWNLFVVGLHTTSFYDLLCRTTWVNCYQKGKPF